MVAQHGQNGRDDHHRYDHHRNERGLSPGASSCSAPPAPSAPRRSTSSRPAGPVPRGRAGRGRRGRRAARPRRPRGPRSCAVGRPSPDPAAGRGPAPRAARGGGARRPGGGHGADRHGPATSCSTGSPVRRPGAHAGGAARPARIWRWRTRSRWSRAVRWSRAAARAGADRSGRLRALGARPVPARRSRGRGRPADPHRVGRAVPRPERRPSSADVTPEQALAHPTWAMGPVVTMNSATLVNKGLELIEAHLLFGVDYDRIDVVVHPQSIVHSMVTFVDGSTLAQASPPDMRLPIALALGWPDRVPGRRAGRATGRTAARGRSSRSTTTRSPPSPRPRRPARRAAPPAVLQRRQRGGRRGVPRGRAALPGRDRRDTLAGQVLADRRAESRRQERRAHRRTASRPQTAGHGRGPRLVAAGTGSSQRCCSCWGSCCSPSASRSRSRCTRRGTCGRPGVRHAGAPLLHRVRPEGLLVHPRRDRVRAQGDPGRRVLRHRRHDGAGRGERPKRRPRAFLPQAHLAARRRAVRPASITSTFLIGMVLVYALVGVGGPAEPAQHPGRRRAELRGNQVSPTALAPVRSGRAGTRPRPRGCRLGDRLDLGRRDAQPRRGRTPSRSIRGGHRPHADGGSSAAGREIGLTVDVARVTRLDVGRRPPRPSGRSAPASRRSSSTTRSPPSPRRSTSPARCS